MIISILLFIMTYVAQWAVYKKMGRQGWEAIVPLYNSYVLFEELYGDGWKFLFLFIPFYNIYVVIKLAIDQAHAFHLGTGFGIGLLLLPFIFLMILAFGDAQYRDGSMANNTEDIISNAIDKTKDIASGIRNSESSVNSGTWICPSCGNENTKKSKFCVACGEKKPDPRTCPYCGQVLAAHMMFCPSCGRKYDLDEYQKHMEEMARQQGKKICKHCGELMPIDGMFCGKCGKSQNVDNVF